MIATFRLFLVVGALASLLVPSAHAADAERGQELWESRCTGCHSLDTDRVGPRHRGVYGRTAGTVATFDYSSAVKSSRIIWTEATMDRWLTDPEKLIPGQRMNFRVALAADRADIIAFLRLQSTP